ncbi:hypothetical protein [Sagittula sp. S175]|uniref:hypothetical protein n=1 Tax=Sagittula sp. S175 TaxID=3415129 RepID=UPI003C7CBD74
MSAKFLTSLIAAGAMAASLSMPTQAAALNQDQRNIVGGIALGVLGTMAIQSATKPKKQVTYVCQNPYRTMRNGQVVWACR